ncbi:MCE family protein [Hoyosella subflava]|uniref:Putative Mce family protein n=1 Tax=Hoyosella subflava (strain DSM 45089 / JCM 17490 / NBRC 109087 / DQS3-9A1) TaxID=443218 RepID=F6EN29_HOYSD|nr:MCE family protein [Hoyosella subflava]AEF39346.1 Putative Mce family protein [Hoyosella subflava DQS3-9A1]
MRITRSHLARAIVLPTALAVTLTVSACEWQGINSLELPGAPGTGGDSYSVRIEMPNVTTLTRNSPVRVNDVAVGSVTGIEVQDWQAIVTVSIEDGVVLPANATAKIGQTSLLGSTHLELAEPVDELPEGRLGDGSLIPLERAGVYATTEQTLSALSVVLNGGGLAQLQDITRELNLALGGNEAEARELVGHLDELAAGLDEQRHDIIDAMSGLDRLTHSLAAETDTIYAALDEIPPALDVLIEHRPNLTQALISLSELGDTATRITEESAEDLQANLESVVPILEALADSGNSLTDVLSLMFTFPFPMKTVGNAVKGDYANLMMTLDLTGPRMDSNFLTGGPLGGSLGGVEGTRGSASGQVSGR